MRRFSSYGPVDTSLHFHVPRAKLVDTLLSEIVGENPVAGGNYITLWAPRQRGKTWIVGQALRRLRQEDAYQGFDIVASSVEHLRMERDAGLVVQHVATEIARALDIGGGSISSPSEFQGMFEKSRLAKPLILILDEFDSLPEDAISAIVGVFRQIYTQRRLQADKPTHERDYLLHGIVLVGVRSVLGIENASGSPFNVQRSLHVPNLTFAEVRSMFDWFEQESGRTVEAAVVERIYQETRGQPGLVSWLGELLTETHDSTCPAFVEHVGTPPDVLTMGDFETVYSDALNVLPNANIQNLIAKIRRTPYRDVVLGLFQTEDKLRFRFDEPHINFLYLNGVVERELENGDQYVRFSCPFVQKRLFNYFSFTHFGYTGRLFDPFEDLTDTITETELDARRLAGRFQRYLRKNRQWLLEAAPRRSDLRIFEAVYHFVLYSYLSRFLQHRGGTVLPEFPAGNGRIDLLVRYAGKTYGLELKSFAGAVGYRAALRQAARYGSQLGLDEITLLFFVDVIDDANRRKYEALQTDEETGVIVAPVFVETS